MAQHELFESTYQKDKDLFDKAKKVILAKEARSKAETEAILLGTAMQQLLPEIFEDKRAIPNSFLRGALFGMVRKGRRALVGELPIFTMSQYDLTFTGYELDQNDLEVWDTLIYLANNKKVDNELKISLYELCKINFARLGRRKNKFVGFYMISKGTPFMA